MFPSRYTIESFKKTLSEEEKEILSRLEIQVGSNGIINKQPVKLKLEDSDTNILPKDGDTIISTNQIIVNED